MRIAHVAAGIGVQYGGPAFAIVGASEALERRGHTVVIFAPNTVGTVKAKSYRPLRATDLPPGGQRLDIRLFDTRPPRRMAFSPSLALALYHQLPRFDVVHIHSLYTFPQWAAFEVCNRLNIPYVVAPCGALDTWLRCHSARVKALSDAVWGRRMLNGARAVQYKTTREEEESAGLGIKAPGVVVPNGIDWASFQTLPSGALFRNKHLEGFNGPVVLFLGRLSYKKGLDVLIRAFARVARDAGAVLAVCGPDDEQLVPVLRALARAEGVDERVWFPGVMQGDEKSSALSAATIWALSSYTENFGMAVVEALAAGRPSVISSGVAISDAVGQADAALIRAPEAAAFAEGLLELLTNPARAVELGSRARAFSRKYDWSVIVPALEALYLSVLADP